MPAQIGLEAIFYDQQFNNALNNFIRNVHTAGAATKSETGSMGSAFLDLGHSVNDIVLKLGTTLVAASAAAAAALAGVALAGINIAADLEQNLADIAAIFGVTIEEVQPLKEALIDLGLDPQLKVTTAEAAEVMERLARNGLDMTQIMGGAARASIQLANATGGDFNNAAQVAVDVINIFNKDASELGEVTDWITGVVNNSKFSLQDFSYFLSNAGGVAAQTGVEFEDFATAAATIANSFRSGRDAGTSYKRMLQTIVPRSAAASDAMEELGLITFESEAAMELLRTNGIVPLGTTSSDLHTQLNDLFGGMTDLENGTKKYSDAFQEFLREQGVMQNVFFDSNGMLKDQEDIFEELDKALASLTEQQRAETVAMIFGTDAIRAANMVANAAKGGFMEMYAELEGTDAAQAAATRMDTFKGSLEVLMGILQEVGRQIGDEFIDQSLTPMIKSLSEIISKHAPAFIAIFKVLGEWFELQSPKIIAAMEAFITGTLIPGFASAADILTNYFIPAIETAIKWIKVELPKAIQFVTEHWDEFKAALIAVGAILAAASATVFLAAAISLLTNPIFLVISAVGLLAAAWAGDWGGIKTWVLNAWADMQPALTALRNWFTEIQPILQAYYDLTIGTIIGAIQKVAPQIQAFVDGVLEKFSVWWEENGPRVEAFMAGIALGLIALQAVFNIAIAFIVAQLINLWQVIEVVLGGAFDAFLNFVDFFLSLFSGDWEGAWDAFINAFVIAFDTLIGTAGAILNWIANIFGTTWAAQWAELSRFFVKLWEDVSIFFINLWESISTGFMSVVNGIVQWFVGAWTTISDFWVSFWTGVGEFLVKTWEMISTAVANAVEITIKAVVDLWEKLVVTFSEIGASIASAATNIYNDITAWASNIWNTVSTWFTNVWIEVKRIWNLVIEAISTAISSVWEIINGVIISIYNMLALWASDTWTVISEWFLKIPVTIEETWDSIRDYMLGMLELLRDKIAEWGQNIWDDIVAIWDRIIASLNNLFDTFVEIGKNIIQGLINGVKAMGSGFLDIIVGVVAGAIDWARNFLGLESPSELTKGMGRDLIRGFQLGVEQEEQSFLGAWKAFDASIVNLLTNSGAQDAAYSVGTGIAHNIETGMYEAIRSATPNPLASGVGANMVHNIETGMLEAMTSGSDFRRDERKRAFSDEINALVDAQMDAIRAAESQTTAAWDEYFRPYTTTSSRALNEAEQYWHDHFKNITDASPEEMKRVSDEYYRLLDEIAATTNTTLNEAEQFWQDHFTNVGDMSVEEAQWAAAEYQRILDSMANAAVESSGAIVSGMGGVAEESTENYWQIIEQEMHDQGIWWWGMEFPDETESAARGYYETWKEIGGQSVESFIEGVMEHEADAVDAATTFLELASEFAAIASSKLLIGDMEENTKGARDALSDIDKDIEKILNDFPYLAGATQRQLMEMIDSMPWGDETDAAYKLYYLQLDRISAAQELLEVEKDINQLYEKQAQLEFLQMQVDMLNMLRDAGLEPIDILGDMQLGLEAGTEDIYNAMIRALDALIQAANDKLELGSPSKVFMGIGENIAAGLQNGIAMMEPVISDVISMLSRFDPYANGAYESNISNSLQPANMMPNVIVEGGETSYVLNGSFTGANYGSVKQAFKIMELVRG